MSSDSDSMVSGSAVVVLWLWNLELNTTKVYRVKGCIGQGSVKAIFPANDSGKEAAWRKGKCQVPSFFGAS